MTRPWPRILAALLLSAAGVVSVLEAVPRLPADTSLDQLLPEDHELRRGFEDFDRAFGTDDALLVAIHDGGDDPVFRPACIAYLDRVVAAVQTHPAVETVISLSNLPDFRILNIGEGVPLPRSFLPEDREDVGPDDRERLLGDPFLADGLLSRDGRTLACWLLLDPALKRRTDYLEAVEELRRRIPDPPDRAGPIELFVTGFPLVHAATLDMLERDGRRFLVLAALVTSVVVLLGGIGWRAMVAWWLSWPPVVGVLALWMLLTERPLHVFSNALLPLLLVTSAAALVHLGRARARYGAGARETWRTLRASALTTLTTAVGYGSLAASPLEPLARLGVELAAGAVLTLAGTAGYLWLLLPDGPLRPEDPPLLRRLCGRVPARLLVPAALLLGAPWYLLAPGRIGDLADFLDYLPPDHERVVEARRARDAVRALTSFEVVVALREEVHETQLRDPAFWERLARFQEDLLRTAGDDVSYLVSPVKLVAYINTKFADVGEAPWEERFRLTPRAVRFAIRWLIGPFLDRFRHRDPEASGSGRLLALYVDYMRQMLSTDGSSVRFACRVPHLSPAQVMALRRRLEERVFADHRGALDARAIYATGYAVLVSETAREVRDTQGRSLLFGGAALSLVLLLVLRSLRLWLAALAVNVLSVSGLVAFVWAADVPLSLYTAVLLAAVLAVVVDDSIHLLLAYEDHGTARGAVAHVGPAITLSSLGLAAGFAVFSASSLPLYRQLAGGAVAGIAVAWFWDVHVLPRWLARRRD